MAAYCHVLDGRLRIKLIGVKGSPDAAQEVERRVRSIAGVERSTANALTSNLPVLYDSARTQAPELVGEREEPIGVEEIGVVADDDALTLPVHPDLPDSRPVSKQFLDRPCDVFDALGRIDPDAGSAPDRVDDTKADGFFRVQHRTVLRYD